MKTLYKYRRWIFVAAVLVAILLLLPHLRGLSVDKILTYTPKSPALAALMLVGVFGAKSVIFMLPSYALYIVSGILFPAWLGILVNYAGLTLEMSLGFLLGRWLGGDKVGQLAAKNGKAARFLAFLSGNSSGVCFLTRLLPMPYPVDIGSMVFGASGMGFFRHLLFSLLGFTPVMVPMTIAGAAASDPLSPQFLVPFGVTLGVLFVLLIAFVVWSRKKKQADGKAEKENPDGQ